MKRIIIPKLPHHVVQRGLDGRQTFFNEKDYLFYITILTDYCRRYEVKILSYCLMPDHVHLIAVPNEKQSLSRCLRIVHSRYTQYINSRTCSKGQFWQGRYSSHVMDEGNLLVCARYIEINPVKREYVKQPEDWRWSSSRAHISGKNDLLVVADFLPEKVEMTWKEFLAEKRPEQEADIFYRHEKSGKPLGSNDFLERVAKICMQ